MGETTQADDAELDTLDEAVRYAVYDAFVWTGTAPASAALAERMGVDAAQLRASYERLALRRDLVLEPSGGDIWMAIPFSAIPTEVRVLGEGVAWWANCAFDGLGIPAMLGQDALVEATCPGSGAPIRVAVRDGRPQSDGCVLHMAVPLAAWWDDIGST